MRILIFTDYDLDGAGSALFIKWLYRDKITELVIVETTESTISNDFKVRESMVNMFDKVFVLDLDLNEGQTNIVDKGNVVVIDHHTQHVYNKHLYKNAKVVIEEFNSCVGLIRDKFGSAANRTDHQEKLIDYIDGYSYTNKPTESLQLNAVYKTYNNPKTIKFIKAFEGGFRPYSILEKNSIKLHMTKWVEQLSNQVFTGVIKSYKTVSIFANFAVGEVAHYIISKHGADIGVVINLDNKTVSFRRSKTSDVDVSVLSKAFCDGGGSPAAAGGNLTDRFANLTKDFK